MFRIGIDKNETTFNVIMLGTCLYYDFNQTSVCVCGFLIPKLTNYNQNKIPLWEVRHAFEIYNPIFSCWNSGNCYSDVWLTGCETEWVTDFKSSVVFTSVSWRHVVFDNA